MFTLCRYKIDIFLRIFLMNPKICYLESMFRARLPSIFHHICHKMPRVLCNLHVVTTWHSPDHAIRKKHATRHDWSACLEKWNSFVKNLAKVSRLSHDFWHVMKHVGMSPSATLSTRNDTAQRLNLQRWPLLQHSPLNTLSPRRLRLVANTKAASSEHVSTPRDAFRKKCPWKKSLWQLKYREKMGEVKCKVRKNMVASVCKVG